MKPKNSLEALENLVHCKSETKCKECKHKNVCTLERDYNIIKSDLEFIKQLKGENIISMLDLIVKEIAKEEIQDLVSAIFNGEREVLRVNFAQFIIQ